MREDILKILKNSEVPMTEIEIQDKLDGITLDKLCEELRILEKCGDVYVTKKGKYTAKVTYYGNTYYNKVVKSVKITVKK